VFFLLLNNKMTAFFRFIDYTLDATPAK